MQKLIFVLTILTFATACRSHKFNDNYSENYIWSFYLESMPDDLKKKIQVIKLEKSIGVIFPAEYTVGFNKEKFKNRFTPSEEDIRKAEIEITKQYLESDRKFIYEQVYVRTKEIYGNQNINKQQTYSDLMKIKIKKAKKNRKFARQYIGFIEDGEKKIVIQFIDFSQDPYNEKDKFTYYFIQAHGGWYDINIRRKVYNLNTKKLTVL